MIRPFMAVAALLFAAPAARAGTLDEEMLQAAPKVLQFLKEQDARVVGVLKFASAEGAGAPTDVGEINRTAAERLELALILRTDVRDPVGVIHDASAIAAQTRGADHTTAAGREKLFAAEYLLAWGGKRVRPDALLTGVVRVEKDGGLNVSLVALLPGAAKALPVARFAARPDVATLVETGGSFTTRGLFDQGAADLAPEQLKAKQTAAAEGATKAALKVREEPAGHPANAAKGSLVAVKILYDGREQKVEFRDGGAWVAEPAEGQRVTFVIEHRDKEVGPLAVVLKVNGESTIERQRQRDPECRKWVLRPGESYTVKGFLKPGGGQTSDPFRVLSPRASKENEFRYGDEVGTIRWSVFRAAPKGGAAVASKRYDELDAEYLNRGLFPAARAETLAQLRKALDAPNADRHRGLIAGDKDNAVETPTEKVEFEADPVPVLTASVRYYKAKK
jgi:hypothetical protein